MHGAPDPQLAEHSIHFAETRVNGAKFALSRQAAQQRWMAYIPIAVFHIFRSMAAFERPRPYIVRSTYLPRHPRFMFFEISPSSHGTHICQIYPSVEHYYHAT